MKLCSFVNTHSQDWCLNIPCFQCEGYFGNKTLPDIDITGWCEFPVPIIDTFIFHPEVPGEQAKIFTFTITGVILDCPVLNCNQLPPSSALKLTKLPLIKFLPNSIVDYIEKFKEASLLIQHFQFDKKNTYLILIFHLTWGPYGNEMRWEREHVRCDWCLRGEERVQLDDNLVSSGKVAGWQ